ncbi:hypothetical protein SBRCBS47491_006338 [Sporothrix bragantina]|uniref:Uncharacterized protein n=1 Tax=Sporothrix bragantina TaxID=671064 RepID=A0ABP0C4L5_9PEZI
MGLGVAASFAIFGLSGIVFPEHATESAFGIPTDPGATESSRKNSAAALLPPLIGVRDLSIAAALAMLYYRRLGWEMGFVIISRTVLCAADTVLITRRKGIREGLLASIGLAAWLLIGFGLMTPSSAAV